MKFTLLLALTALCAGHVLAAQPHEHGTASVDVAIDGNKLLVRLETPLENLLGFERAPRNDAERKSVALLLATLQSSAKLLRIDPAAGCLPGAAELMSPALGWGQAATGAGTGASTSTGKTDTHADLDASYSFECQRAHLAAYIELTLFEAFPRLSRLNVQVATGKGQSKITLKRPAQRVALTR